MRLSKKHQIKFYYKEIEAIMKEYQSYLNSGVKDLLNRNELFIGKYVYSDTERGNVVFSFEKQKYTLN